MIILPPSALTNVRRYRSITPKARLIPLTPAFLSYLREDGIVLPPDNDSDQQPSLTDTDSGIFSAEDDSEDEDALLDPSIQFREVHQKIKGTIDELGGKVTPKLNWSAPKDATWIATTNSMECRTPSDIYLLLKSSDFITHDLEHAFDDCVDEDPSEGQEEQTVNTPTSTSTPTIANTSSTQPYSEPPIPYHLVLRKYLPNLNPALEFRCFVRNRTLLCLCQRDLNHFAFLVPMRDQLLARIQSFFDHNLKATFPDPNFAFDVYLPEPHTRVWLVDINPWAPRTDPLLFSWLEILTLPEVDGEGEDAEEEAEVAAGVCRLSIRRAMQDSGSDFFANGAKGDDSASLSSSSSSSSSFASLPFVPEFRLVAKDDPEAYAFNTPRYSAHKLPRDVVDAAASGDVEGAGGLREFVGVWKDVLARRRRGEEGVGDGDDSD